MCAYRIICDVVALFERAQSDMHAKEIEKMIIGVCKTSRGSRLGCRDNSWDAPDREAKVAPTTIVMFLFSRLSRGLRLRVLWVMRRQVWLSSR
jgi:hypothetical protein